MKTALSAHWPGISCSNALDKAGPVSLSKPQAKASNNPSSIVYNLTHQNVIQSNSHYPEPGQVEPHASTHQNGKTQEERRNEARSNRRE